MPFKTHPIYETLHIVQNGVSFSRSTDRIHAKQNKIYLFLLLFIITNQHPSRKLTKLYKKFIKWDLNCSSLSSFSSTTTSVLLLSSLLQNCSMPFNIFTFLDFTRKKRTEKKQDLNFTHNLEVLFNIFVLTTIYLIITIVLIYNFNLQFEF